MKITETKLSGVLIIEPPIFGDGRGIFFESYHHERYSGHGLKVNFVQDNFSRSSKNVLRGLHYQLEKPQGKLIWVTRGQVFDVVVDVRKGSPTFGQSLTTILDAERIRQLYVPPGFAHGFCVLSDEADFSYKCTDYYYPAAEKGILWNDPDLKIQWPVTNPILSAKDQKNLCLKNIAAEDLPTS